MAQVTVRINGRGYPISCEDGEEDHLVRLGRYLDKRVQELAKRFGQIGEAHLMVMTGLMVVDELSEANQRAQAAREGATAEAETRLAEALTEAAEAVETIAARLETV